MGRFLKRHRYTCVLVLIFILFVILGFKIKEVLVPDEGKATYGERLRDIDKYPIDESVYKKIDEAFEKNDKVLKITHRLQGKVLNFYLTFNDKVSPKDAKAEGEKVITYLDENLLSYYSIQLYLIKEDEALNNFPIIGIKDPLSSKVSWSKDRDITESDVDEE